MSLRIKHLLFILTTAFIFGCTSPTKYKSAGTSGPGYQTEEITDNTYRVSFKGNDDTSRETVETYLLYRAAELALQKGHDSFVIIDYATEVETEYTTASPTVFGYYSMGYPRFPYHAFGYPWAYYDDRRVPVDRRYQAIAYVRLIEDRVPASDDKAFNAKEVKETLQPKIERPSE